MPCLAVNCFSKILDQPRHNPPMYGIRVRPDKWPGIAQQSCRRNGEFLHNRVSNEQLIPLIRSQIFCNRRLLHIELPAENCIVFEYPDGIEAVAVCALDNFEMA